MCGMSVGGPESDVPCVCALQSLLKKEFNPAARTVGFKKSPPALWAQRKHFHLKRCRRRPFYPRSCSYSPTVRTATPTTIKLGLEWFLNPDHLPLVVALREGYFAEAGLDVQLPEPAATGRRRRRSSPVALTSR